MNNYLLTIIFVTLMASTFTGCQTVLVPERDRTQLL